MHNGGGKLRVGVLALQGAFAKHIAMLERLGVLATEVRKRDELALCDALIIPGGESTVMMRQIQVLGLREPLVAFAAKRPVFGTCAGMVLMAQEELGDALSPLGILDIAVERNGYGRQVESFQVPVKLPFKRSERILATFIRAPIIRRYSPEVKILATYGDTPILVQQGKHLSAAFHPELSDNLKIHKLFISNI